MSDDDIPEGFEELPDNVVQLVPKEKTEAAMARLAELSRTEYEQVRTDEASPRNFARRAAAVLFIRQPGYGPSGRLRKGG